MATWQHPGTSFTSSWGEKIPHVIMVYPLEIYWHSNDFNVLLRYSTPKHPKTVKLLEYQNNHQMSPLIIGIFLRKVTPRHSERWRKPEVKWPQAAPPHLHLTEFLRLRLFSQHEISPGSSAETVLTSFQLWYKVRLPVFDIRNKHRTETVCSSIVYICMYMYVTYVYIYIHMYIYIYIWAYHSR